VKQAFQRHPPFTSAAECIAEESKKDLISLQMQSPSSKLAFGGQDFLLKKGQQMNRLLLEFEKCDSILKDNNVDHTIVVFGGARLEQPKIALEKYDQAKIEFERGLITQQALLIKKNMAIISKYYEEARKFGEIVGCNADLGVICTGGGN
jgi:hypothetical protein